jgi:hypothetical protein
VRAPRPCSRALSRHEPRRLLRPRGEHATTWSCAHATRAVAPAPSRRWQTRHSPRRLLRRDANHQLRASRLSPRSCRALRATLAPIRGASTRRVSHARRDREAVAAWAMARSRASRCNARSDRHAVEHGRPATWRGDARRRSRECTRQDRGEVRAHHRAVALSRHAPRALPRVRWPTRARDHVVVRSRDTGSGVCSVAPSQTRHSPRRSPRRTREPPASRIAPLPSVLPGPSRDARPNSGREHATCEPRTQ